MHLANQRPGKPDKLSQGAHNQKAIPEFIGRISYIKGGLQNPRERNGSLEPESGSSNNRVEHKVKEQEQEHMTTHAAGS